METVTGNQIDTAVAEWTTPKGAKIQLTVIRNAELGLNGYLPSDSHSIKVEVNGVTETFYGAYTDEKLGFVVAIRMGKAKIQVPSADVSAVKALIDEYESNNDAVRAAEREAESRYQADVDAIREMMDA